MRTALTLADLATIDRGRLAAAFELELRRIARDIEDRPNEKKPRTLKITLGLSPDVGPEDGLLDGFTCQAKVESSVPARQSKPYSFAIGEDGQVEYETTNAHDHRQGHLFEEPAPPAPPQPDNSEPQS